MKRLVAVIGIITAIATILIVVELTGRLPKDLYTVLFDWIVGTATLAAVVVALFFGIKSLHQTRDIKRTERKQGQIKEIEEWAKEVIRFIDEYERGRGTADLWYHIKWRWQILRATKANMSNTAYNIDKDFGQKVDRAVASFKASDKNIDKGIISNIQNDLETCRRSCEEILETGGSLKFEEAS